MLIINVCVGSACHVRGGYSVINTFQNIVEEKRLGDRVRIKAVLCLGSCSEGVSVRINDEDVLSVNEKSVGDFFESHIMSRI